MSVLRAAERRAQVAAVFDRVADTYDSVGVSWFQPIARELVARLGPAAGQRALDIGCGRGAALFALADAVGPAGRVTGIDLAPRMVAATLADARARGLANVDVVVDDAGAPVLPPGACDVAAASFVLFFLPAPVAALRAWHELLAPGGRLGVSTFAEAGAGWLQDVFRPYLPVPAFAAPSPFATDEGVEGLFTAAGFRKVRTEAFDLDVTFADVDQWYEWSWSHGQRATWERLAPEDRPRVRAAAAERLREFRAADGVIRLSHRIRYTFGER
jgi:ubiquinone/menaquinone biosynthesis C-methylase UbiE